MTRIMMRFSTLIIIISVLFFACHKKNNPPDAPSTPTGITSGSVDSSYTYTSSATDPDEDNIAIRFSWGDGSFSDWSSYTSSGSSMSLSHTYYNGGTFYIEAQAKDDNDTCSIWSEPHIISILSKLRTPSTPSGPSNGYINTVYTFSSFCVDSSGNAISIRFAWGDGDTSVWSGWMETGDTVSVQHTYGSIGNYAVKTQAKNIKGNLSYWSASHSILITAGSNNPPNTPATPSGPSSGYTNISYNFSSSTTDPDGDSIAIRFVWANGDTSTWSSYQPSGSTITMSHSWASPGTYYITAQARDIHGSISGWSSSYSIVITVANNPPNTPSTPSGPSSGYPNTSYNFSSSTTDPDGDSIAIRFVWANGDTSTWSSFVPSGSTVTMSHSWASSGTYYITAQAKDKNGAISAWSNSHEIIISEVLIGMITFTSDRDDNYEIYVMNADGSNQTRVTNNSAQDHLPSWSPNCIKIAFTTNRDSNDEIYVMNADGSNQIRLTNNSAFDLDPSWSPDGNKIAFTSDRNGNDVEIYVMYADGSNQINLTNNSAFDMDPSWSPDGNKIAFTSDRNGNDDVCVMNADGTNQINLTNNSTRDMDPSWSPDGTKIAFSSYRDGNYEIYVMNADGSNQTRVTNNSSWDVDPVWSPDNAKIAFSSLRDGNWEVYVMNADGSNQIRLTNNSAWDGETDWK